MADGFKDSTKTRYYAGGPAGGPKGAAQTSHTMRAFKQGGRASTDDLNRSNRDTGGLDAKAERAVGAAVARGNRMQAMEAAESRLVRRKAADPKSVVREGELGRFGLQGYKCGGLAAMPKGKR